MANPSGLLAVGGGTRRDRRVLRRSGTSRARTRGARRAGARVRPGLSADPPAQPAPPERVAARAVGSGAQRRRGREDSASAAAGGPGRAAPRGEGR